MHAIAISGKKRGPEFEGECRQVCGKALEGGKAWRNVAIMFSKFKT